MVSNQKYSDENFMFIAGQEISTDKGDVIGLMLNQNINSSHFFDVVDEIKSQDGIVYLPHPSRKMKLSAHSILNSVDLIESVNGRSALPTISFLQSLP